MPARLAHVTLLVRDYDAAIEFFVTKLRFDLVEDTFVAEQNKRWVLVTPRGSRGTSVLLAKAATDEQQASVGNQAGGRVSFFLGTDDFWGDYDAMRAAGVKFVREPKSEGYGTVAVFEDLYGNRWDLLEHKTATEG